MEKIGSAPAVAHFPLPVHPGTCRHFEFDLFEIFSEQGTGDFGVRADGVFAMNGLEIADRGIDGVEVFSDIFCCDWDLSHRTGKNPRGRGSRGGRHGNGG